MNLNNFLKIAKLTPKEIALINYFRINDVVDRYNGDFSLSVNSKDGYADYSLEEIEEMTNSYDEKIAVGRWKNIIAFVLNLDLTAEKYFYQMKSVILEKPIIVKTKVQNEYIRNCYFKFLTNAFTAMVMNRIFNSMINIKSPDLLIYIQQCERESPDFCLLLRQEYLKRKEEIVKVVKSTIQTIVDTVRDDEFISQGFITASIDSAQDYFTKSFNLIDFNDNSDTIGLKRKGKKV